MKSPKLRRRAARRSGAAPVAPPFAAVSAPIRERPSNPDGVKKSTALTTETQRHREKPRPGKSKSSVFMSRQSPLLKATLVLLESALLLSSRDLTLSSRRDFFRALTMDYCAPALIRRTSRWSACLAASKFPRPRAHWPRPGSTMRLFVSAVCCVATRRITT